MILPLTLLAVGLLLPVLWMDSAFLAEVLLGIRRGIKKPLPLAAAPSIAILMPAHNEQSIFTQKNQNLASLLAESIRVLVVADNCSDDTATAARRLGCEVIERTDPLHIGKGYALAFGRDHLMQASPDVVLILDADCAITPEHVRHLAMRAVGEGLAVQATYLFRYYPDASPKVQISNFAFAIKNLVRQRGARRLGAAAILAGSGMAFPWPLFIAVPLATDDIVEDLALGIALLERGAPPQFEEHAVVWSDASSADGTSVQRTRWEAGFLSTAHKFAPPLLVEGLRKKQWQLFWMGVHLTVPPLTLLLLGHFIVLILLGILTACGAAQWPFFLLLIFVALLTAAIAAAWFAEGRKHATPAILLRLPYYIFWKLTMHLRLLFGSHKPAWTRTERIDHDELS